MESSYKGHRFPPEIISHAVWLYHRFTLSLRDVEDLLAERGIIVSYEAIRFWCLKFGAEYARRLRQKEGRLGDIWHVDEIFVKVHGRQLYLWRAVDQDGDVLDILVTKRRNKQAAKRFFRKVLKGQGSPPWQLVTDKLTSYPAAHRRCLPFRGASNGSVREQQSCSLPSTHSGERTPDASIQVNGSGSATFSCTWAGAEFVPDGPTPPESSSSSTAARSSIQRLERGDVCLLSKTEAGVSSAL